ncbi:MAG TPA: TOMM precursor leader peptide-binding protein [Streptosporangiaceae bacterium]|nr:TOMM precursor leader peptide-binding protein [Streptosporangiaceae bacterium]
MGEQVGEHMDDHRGRRPAGIVGDGAIASALAARLDGPVLDKASLGRCSAVAVVSDSWPAATAHAVTSALRDTGVPWLSAHVEIDEAVIGPVVRPGLPGCAGCVSLRRARAGARGGYWEALGELVRQTPPPPPPSFAVGVIAEFLAEELALLASGEREPRTLGAFVVLRFGTLESSSHRFLPDPSCPQCGGLPDDTADAAVLTPVSRPKAHPRDDRVADLRVLGPRLLDRFVDGQAGLVPDVRQLECFGLAVASAPIGWRDRTTADLGTGRTLDHETSRYAAVLEALERYCGLGPSGRRTSVRAPYSDLGGQAVDPHTFGLYPDDWYEQPGFRYRRFDPAAVTDWVWAHSFRRGAPVLVPESLAYYGTPYWTAGAGPAYEISNGCALGSCLEEAVLHGILEVAERDAFLLTWYGRLPVPELDPGTAADRRLPLLIDRIQRHSGCTVRIFDTTVEQGIPSCWVIAHRHPGAQRGTEPTAAGQRAAALCAAGAGLVLERACVSAVTELATMLGTIPRRYAQEAGRVAEMVTNSDLVRTMSDHGLLYCDPRTTERLGFLLDRQQRRPFRVPEQGHTDLRDDVCDLVGRYLGCGLDVIVVDQTSRELATAGLSCVKVLIPGTLPMTFGHRYRRVHGLTRALTVPHTLGYSPRPLTPGELNPHPHPFP